MDHTQVADTWERGSPYEQYVGRWSRRVAPLFLKWLGIPAGRRWLDVGCGTGALCAAIVDRCAPSSVAGVEPSEGFSQVPSRISPGALCCTTAARRHSRSATRRWMLWSRDWC
jgi:SAM-dependent methyltransferase